jgi:glycosyltransferase involved in cell wall biosynthesis
MNTSNDSANDVCSPLRLKIVCPRFWPFSGSTEFAASDLAESIADRGVDTEVITAGWEKEAPATFGFRNFRVQRIYRSTSNPWGNHRYQKNLRRYLINSQPDGIIFFDAFAELQQLAKTLAESLAETTTVIVRVHDHSLSQLSKNSKNWQRFISQLKMADRVIVESHPTKIDLCQAGVDDQRIFVANDIILLDMVAQSDFTSQATARHTISIAHPMLSLSSSQPLIICAAPMFGDKGMLDLIDAWPYVARQNPAAKLWILGHGPASKKIWDRIMAKQLTNSIVMLGQFDDWSDVMRAADAYVHPLRNHLNCSMLGRAMSTGVCPIVCEAAATAVGLTPNQNVIVAPTADPQQLAAAILRPIDRAQECIDIGLAAAQWAHQRYDVKQNIDAFLSALKPSATKKLPTRS